MNEIVKYNNDMNICTNLKGFNKNELNFLMAICSKMKYKGENEVIFTFEQLEKLTQWKDKNKKDFIKSLKNTNKKLLELNFELKTESKIVQFALFPTFEIDLNNDLLIVEVHKKFSFLLNQIANNFTKFELEHFTSLKSKYSQLLYKELMQFKTTGYRKFILEDFKNKLDIPKTYQMTHIKTKILKPVMIELSKILENFRMEQKSLGKGKTITHFEFFFKPIQDEDKFNECIEICEIEQYWLDNFPGVNYTSKHKAIIEKMKEKDSILYIKNYLMEQWNYVKNNNDIDNKIAYFSSLILGEKAVLKNYISDKKINDKEDKLQADNFIKELEEKTNTTRQDIEVEQTSLFITEITKEEYKKIYQEYLKNNNLEDNDITKKVFDISNKNKYKIIEKKIYTVDDIDPNLLLSKNGKKLFGGALKTRINKILDEMNKKEGI